MLLVEEVIILSVQKSGKIGQDLRQLRLKNTLHSEASSLPVEPRHGALCLSDVMSKVKPLPIL